MKTRLISAFALAGLLISSCATEELLVAGGSIAAEIDLELDTRTSVTDEGFFTWSAGDKVWIHTTSGGVTGTLSSGAGTASANFSYGTYLGDMTGKAVYPYNSGHSISGDVLTVNLPATYELGSVRDNTNALMYGVSQNNSFKFNHMAGVMRFNLKNVPAGANQFKITLDKKINGEFTADLTESHPSVSTEVTSNDSEKTITLNFDALTQTTDLRLCFPLPVGTYNTLALELNSATANIWSYSNTVRNTVNRKGLVLMPTVNMGGSVSGDIENGGAGSATATDLSSAGTANSYIVSQSGTYTISPVKGNSSESVGSVSSVEVLWESFGTSETPAVGSLISSVTYEDGKIKFSTPSTYREGNAVIAARNSSGTILWSWHIWLTDQPEGQVYYNNAGTMMDRNLGATSATPGDVGALGLLYQWGRKDPFLGSSSISSDVVAKSTITWPSYVESDSSNGTISYSVEHPTTFIVYNSKNNDWHYTGSSSFDNTRWTTSGSSKSVYDPCPVGWRVPDGGSDGVWSKAVGSSSSFSGYPYDRTNKGMNFSGTFGSSSTIWYPASGYRYDSYSSLAFVGYCGAYWSASLRFDAFHLEFGSGGGVYPSHEKYLANGLAVRCLQVID